MILFFSAWFNRYGSFGANTPYVENQIYLPLWEKRTIYDINIITVNHHRVMALTVDSNFNYRGIVYVMPQCITECPGLPPSQIYFNGKTHVINTYEDMYEIYEELYLSFQNEQLEKVLNEL